MRSGSDLLGIPIAQVREVVRPIGLRAVPGSPPVQAGIVNVRGAIVTVLDLAALRTGVRAVTTGSIVLLSYGTRMLGLAVEAVHDVRGVNDDADAERASLSSDLAGVMPLDAVALCARHMHSGEERER